MESMHDTPARLLKLLSLLQTPREWPGSELAERLAVTPRTVRRDIDRLRELGYPVDATLGAQGGYRLVAGAALPPLLLDDDEAVAVVLGLRTAARQPVAGIAEASLRALGKLQQVLPTRLRRRLGALAAATAPAPGPERALVDPEQLTILAAAIAAGERVRFAYGPTGARRLVEPHRLVPVGRRWYLLAWDNERHDWRTFRADRITDTNTTGVRVPPREPPGGDATAFVTSRLYDLAPVYAAEVTLHAPAAAVAPALGDAAADLEPVDDRTCRWHARADTLEWLAFRLTALGCDFEVHDPPELVDHLRALGDRITRAVSAGADVEF
jgi:predicted DNA-binding transcriptional regulator YafY